MSDTTRWVDLKPGERAAFIANLWDELGLVDDESGCEWDVSDPSHGPMSCGNEREPGSQYCPPHKAEYEALEAAGDDMDRLEDAR